VPVFSEQSGPTWPPELAAATTAAARANAVLLQVGRAVTSALAARTEEIRGRSFTDGIFEAFWYPDDGAADDEHVDDDIESDEYNHSCPCPAHTDPGIVTVIAETAAALEVRPTGGGAWHRLHLGADEMAIVTGQQLDSVTGGRVPACTHRVSLTPSTRSSYVFELYLRPTPEEAAAIAAEEAAEEAAAQAAEKQAAAARNAASRRERSVSVSVSILVHRASSRLLSPRRRPSARAQSSELEAGKRCIIS
jgi:isopenicillin N synthase-like dioxygenase